MSARPGPFVGAVLVLVSCLGVQTSAALSSGLFGALSVPAVAGLRQATAALVLCVLVRPRVRRRGRGEWAGILAYGSAMAGMNVAFYGAVDRLPLGVAAALLFLGPFAVAVASVRTRRDALFPLVGLVGVVLVTRPGGGVEWLGIGFGLLSALALALYTVFAQRVGRADTGLHGLGLSVAVSAVLLLPFSGPAVPRVEAGQWALVGLSGVLGVALAFTLDFTAVRLAGATVVAVLFALDPVAGTLVGVIALGEGPPPSALAGITLIVASGAAVTWRAGTAPSADGNT
ncbi:EamA family transporter [Embleya sp. NPDC005971]|uniref:EamA family transporter n=1 Tax=unclassified Embleya TaxID=2699296 RepID=UPI0033E6F786